MVLRLSMPGKLLTLVAFLIITLSILPQTATAVTTNQYKAILGEEGALAEHKNTWAHAFKLSKWFYPYTIYWNQRGILGFNNTIEYSDGDVLDFVESVIRDAETTRIGDALILNGYEKKVNLVLRYYTGRYTYTNYYFDNGGDDVAVYVGDYNLTVDPTKENILAEKVVNFIKTSYPELYGFLQRLGNGLESVEVEEAGIRAFGNATELRMVFSENLTDLGAYAEVRLEAVLAGDDIVRISVMTLMKIYDDDGATWARALGKELISYVESLSDRVKEAGINVTFLDQSMGGNSVNYQLRLYLNGTPIYIGAQGSLTAGVIVLDGISGNGKGEFNMIFIDETPYLLKVLEHARKDLKLSQSDALRAAGLEGHETRVRKVWVLTSDGLVPAYIIRYSDRLGEHVRVVDASTGDILYSSDGGLGSASPAPDPYLSSYVRAMAGAAAAVGAGAAAVTLWRRRKH